MREDNVRPILITTRDASAISQVEHESLRDVIVIHATPELLSEVFRLEHTSETNNEELARVAEVTP